MRMLHGDERLEKGIVHHSKRHPENKKKVVVTCLICSKERFVLIPRGKQREREGFTGACHACGTGYRTDVWTHPNGAPVFFNKRERGKRHLVPFICLNCGEEKITWVSQVCSTKKKWLGWCSECIEKRENPRKLTHEVTLFTGSKVCYGERHPTARQRVAVICGFPGCGDKRFIYRQPVEATQKHQPWTGYCRKHKMSDVAALLLRLQEKRAEQQNGNAGKRRRKPPVKQINKPPMVLGKTIDDLNAAILKLYDTTLVNSEVTETKVASELGLGRPNHGDEGHENVRRILRRNNVKDSFPHYRDKLIVSRRLSMPNATGEHTAPQFNGGA